MEGCFLAEFNLGVLRHDWDDPRIADFADGIEPVMALAERAAGFVWRMPDDEMENEQCDPNGPLGGNPRIASTLSVWRDVASLEDFVWNTVHWQFYDRRAEWHDLTKPGVRLVMWWVPKDHIPTVQESVERLGLLEHHGNTDQAFGWSHLKGAKLWKTHGCAQVAERT